MRPKVIVVLGQTATGKTDLAIRLAQDFDGEIISADSRQIYRGMDLGTGKVTQEETKGISHHLLDIKNPDENYSAEEFQKNAFEAIETILLKNKIPIICGGTGYYIQTVVDNLLFQNVPPDKKLREELEQKSIEELKNIVSKIPQEKGVKVDTENKRRLIRAIELGTHFGKISCLQNQKSKYDFLLIGLKIPQNILDERIKIRLQKRIEDGMIKEVENLHKNGLPWQKLESFGLEYKYIALFLQKQIESLEQLTQILAIKIRQYAKRQMTWFQRDERITWFSPENYEVIKAEVLKYLQK